MNTNAPGGLASLLAASHPGPTAAVTLLAAAYGVAQDLPVGRLLVVVAAVLTGQLSIGWSNDLVDLARDRAVGRLDKPLATGAVSARTVRLACALALVCTVVLSFACGLVAGLVHLVVVASGWAYNLHLKSSPLSFVPFALAFGAMPVFVTLAAPEPAMPVWGVPVATALLGVGAHLLNVVPDLRDDERTGVRGLGHRLGERTSRWLAVAVLVSASAVLTAAAAGVPLVLRLGALALVAVLASVAVTASGRAPFRASLGIAAVGVILLVLAR